MEYMQPGSDEVYLALEDASIDGLNPDYFELLLDENDQAIAVRFFEYAPPPPSDSGDPATIDTVNVQAKGGTGANATIGVNGQYTYSYTKGEDVTINRDAQGRVVGTSTTTKTSYTQSGTVGASASGSGSLGGLVSKIVRFFKKKG